MTICSKLATSTTGNPDAWEGEEKPRTLLTSSAIGVYFIITFLTLG
uniref:Uncharacterized protein n=1 Tax=Vibrio tasmaniensis TaxID=212663 RepID=A0A0H3ZRP1_9VIBR|nr:hypothetical protein [Vibrio tasmaniensis]